MRCGARHFNILACAAALRCLHVLMHLRGRLSRVLQGLSFSDGHHGCIEHDRMQMSAGLSTCTVSS